MTDEHDENTPTDSPLALVRVDRKLDKILEALTHNTDAVTATNARLDRIDSRMDGVERRTTRLELGRIWIPMLAAGASLVFSAVALLLALSTLRPH